MSAPSCRAVGKLPPERRHQVRRTPCKRCPIYREGPDPECEDIKGFVAQGLMPLDEAVYTCAWTVNRKCRGAFEFYKEARAP